MPEKPTRRRILTAAALLLGFVLLAASLNQFELATGLRFESRDSEYIDVIAEVQRSVSTPWTEGFVLGWLVSAVLGLAVILFFVGLIRRESRLSTIILVIVSLPLIWLFAQLPPPQLPDEEELIERGEEAAGEGGGAGIVETIDAEDAVDTSVSQSEESNPLGWFIGAAAVVGLVLVLRPSLPSLRRHREQDADASIASSAAEADAAIRRGEQVLEVVIRCYREMLEAYQDTRFAGRVTMLTPRELADRLKRSSVPAEAADGLTDLFERARYGKIELSKEQEAEAIGHLKAITGALGAS